MRRYLLCALLTTSLLLFFASVNAGSGRHDNEKIKFTKHFNESLFRIADKGEVSIEILPDEKEYKIGRNVIGIVIHDKYDKDVEGAKLEVIVEASEGSKEQSTVKDKGDGLYTAMGLDIQRSGRWALRINVKHKNIEDSAVFVFPDVTKEHIPAGKYDKDSAVNIK
jgi:hypothetical protein